MPGKPARFWVARRARAYSCISGRFLLVLKLAASGTARRVYLRPAGGKSTVKNCSKNRKQENCKPRDVKLFPQGYAAILQHSDLLNEPSVILADIGGWTVDIMRLDNRIPNASSCRSLELGMIRCLDEIAEQVRRSLNLSLTGAQIENVLRGSPDSMDDRVKAIIQREAGLYARRILSAIAEAGLDCRAMPVVFLGGGAGLMKRYLPQGSVLRPVILDDDKLNAQAYERLASQVAGHAG